MFRLLLSILAVAGSPSAVSGPDIVQDRNFSIRGFYCDDSRCEGNPRPLGDALEFEVADQKALLRGSARLAENWNATLNCAVAGDRLERCRLADQYGSATIGAEIALGLTRRIVLRPVDPAPRRAIVLIAYETGGCPSWFCISTPPAPPAVSG